MDLVQSVHADAYTRSPRRYRLGFVIGQHRGRKLVTHGGGGFGCGSTMVANTSAVRRASFAMLPEQQIAVTVLFNHPAGYAVDLLDDLLDEPPEGDPRHPVGEFLHRHLPKPSARPPSERNRRSGGVRHSVLVLDDQWLPLELVDGSVFATPDDQFSVGFVPGDE